ncbi:protein kinase [Oscillatoria sp. CS-180]|uniref:protein kinase domain-containing protein n=1 Tax=Oscillatoria sp. CS-180 TaxID=3021720 RepID=UPI00232ABCC6|nr:protein kinase [Oscillatoria sp. CS-180]MDB9525321.1 protein kinase [Oscillatoria sp. CS-180]
MNHDISDNSQGQRMLAAIVLTDAVGFSARMALDEEHTLSLIQQDLRLIEKLCQQFEGRVVKSTGDGLLLCFVSAVQAVSCSLEVQRQLARSHGDHDPRKTLRHRIGVHLGDVFFRNSDVMGNGVNIAARLQTEARPGGICISQLVYDVVKARLTLNATFAGPLKLKNIHDPQPAYHIDPDLPPPPKPVDVPDGKPEDNSPRLGGSREKLPPSSKIGGRYVVQRVLGQGGFGRSYLVEDSQRFGEKCVLKEFFPTNTSKRSLQKALDLFKREAKTLYQINHPQVPKFLAGFTQEQRLFIVQEFIDGVTYSQLLKERKRNGQTFTELEVKRWLVHMLQVLEYLHDFSIVHRDISPDNVMYSHDRELPILIDFGLVNDAMSDVLSSEEDVDDMPESGTMVGKFGYSPPEQIQLGKCFPCSDLYALGITAIVLITGRYPRDLLDRDSLEWQWQKYVFISHAFKSVLIKLTRRQPRERYQTAKEVLEAIFPLLESDDISSPLPHSYLTATQIDLSPDPNAAPVFSSPVQTGEATTLQDEAFLSQCRQELTRCIGPMASLVMEDVLDQHPNASPEELVRILASQLSDGKQAEQFVSSIHLPPAMSTAQETRPQSSEEVSKVGSTNAQPSFGTSNWSQEEPKVTVSPEFVARCRKVLTQCIGPMADLLIEEVLADHPNLGPQALVRQLAAEIPDAHTAQEFQQRLL